MVESWYDAKMAAEAEAIVAEPSPPAGLSAQQATDNPELAKKIAAEQETLDGLRARIDGFPKKEGTMYFICKEKAEKSEMLIEAMVKREQEAAEKKAKAAQVAAEKKAAAEAKKAAAAEAAAAKKAQAAEEKQRKVSSGEPAKKK